MKFTAVIIVTFLSTFFHFSVNDSYGAEGRMTPLTIYKNHVEASIKAEDCFNYDLEEMILNGIPVKLFFDIKLFCQSSYWFDQEISSLRINHVIKYDTLKDMFTISYSDKTKPPVEVDDLAEAELLVTSAHNLKIETQKALNPKKDYYIKYKVDVKADTENSHLPLYLDYLLKLFQW